MRKSFGKKGKVVRVSNLMQKNYRYVLIEPAGRNFHPDFKPDLTPKQMFKMGVFGGVYMRDSVKEFPRDWFVDAKFQKKGSDVRDAKLNYFGVNASQTLEEWQRKGWINEKCDPRGWFEWYCRYYMGRRLPAGEDDRQIKRWKAMRRHMAQIANNCRPKDMACRPVQRQALLHWAYDSRKI